ncbi:hypothetical protein ACU8KH_02438 [Lachancea thermotolerans]
MWLVYEQTKGDITSSQCFEARSSPVQISQKALVSIFADSYAC